MNHVDLIALNEKSFETLLSRPFAPFESLEVLIGVVLCDMFIVLGCVSCTINGSVMSKRVLKIAEDPSGYEPIAGKGVNALRNCQLLGLFDRHVDVSKEILEVMQEIKKMANADLSIAIVHNHPIIKDENLSKEEQVYFQMAYDLSGEKASYSDWLNGLQAKEFTEEDINFIKAFSDDGLGILIHGTRPECLPDYIPIKDVMSAFQIREDSIHEIDMGVLPLDFWKKLGIFHEISTLEKYISKICEQIS